MIIRDYLINTAIIINTTGNKIKKKTFCLMFDFIPIDF